VRSFKIEGRYKDAPYVKNITGHYRQLLDEILNERPELHAASSGKTKLLFTPNPDKTFHRGATDYFSQGRKADIGAFDTPTFVGLELGTVTKLGDKWFEMEANEELANSDGLNYLHKREVIGLQANVVERKGNVWRVFPNEPMHTLLGLRVGTAISRNRDHAWELALNRKSAERKIGVSAVFAETAEGYSLTLTDEDCIAVTATAALETQSAKNPAEAEDAVRSQLSRLGNTDFELHAQRLPPGRGKVGMGVESLNTSVSTPTLPLMKQLAIRLSPQAGKSLVIPLHGGGNIGGITIEWRHPQFVPTSLLNQLRRDAVEQLEAARLKACIRPMRKAAVVPPASYPEESLTFLANVYNTAAQAFYAKHGIKLIAAAYEAHQEEGEVSLMITRHCIRYSLSLCPKQAKGVIGVQGQVRAEPMTLINGSEKLRLEFDCKKCEMHVMGKMKKHILKTPPPTVVPVTFHARR
jgi:putative protease